MIRNKISHYGAKDGDLEFALSRMLHVHALSNLCQQGYPQRRLADVGAVWKAWHAPGLYLRRRRFRKVYCFLTMLYY